MVFSLLFSINEIIRDSSPTVLKLSGSGKITNEAKNDPFWRSIIRVEVNNDISTLGTGSFFQNPTLQQVVLADSVVTLENEVFSQCPSLQTVDLGNCVSSIGHRCFLECRNLLNVKFSPTLASVGTECFLSCINLTEAIFPLSAPIATISSSCFLYCGITRLNTSDFTTELAHQSIRGTRLQIVYLGKAMATINNWALGGISTLHTIVIHPENINFIVYNHLLLSYDKKTLWYVLQQYKNTELPIPSFIEVMEGFSYQFTQASALTFSADSKLNRLGHRAFQGSTKPTTIIFPASLRQVDEYCFEASKISKIILQEGLTTLQVGAFCSMANLDNLFIPSTVSNMAAGVFVGNPKLVNFEISSQNPNYKYEDGLIYGSSNTEIMCFLSSKTTQPSIRPETVKFGDQAFQGTSLKSIVIPEGITYFGVYCFRNSMLTSINVPKSIQTIKSSCFTNSRIVSFTIPKDNSLTSVEYGCFTKCVYLETVDFGENCQIDSFAHYIFTNCERLTKVLNAKKVKKIGENAFYDDFALEFVEIDWANLESIENKAFYNCKSLLDVKMLNSACSLGTNLFENNEKMRILTLNIATIVENSFIKIFGLETLNLGAAVNDIQFSSFADCISLSDINFDSSIQITTMASFAFGNCTSLTEVTLPSSINSITAMTFSKCSNLLNVYVKDTTNYISESGVLYSKNQPILILCPNGRASITTKSGTTIFGEGSFYGCSNMETAMISSGVQKISSFCFFECSKLKTINIPSTVNFIGEKAFWETSIDFVIFCKDSTSGMTAAEPVFQANNIRVIVPFTYNSDVLFQQKVIKSNSVKDDGCPNPPSGIFTNKKRNQHLISSFLISFLHSCLGINHFKNY